MWAALFGSEEKGTLVLQPDPSAAARVSGFKAGGSLRVAADAVGQTVGEILEKFNKYRGPDQQLRHVWTPEGAPVNLQIPVRGFMTVVVRGESV
jgi:hypothetical protein